MGKCSLYAFLVLVLFMAALFPVRFSYAVSPQYKSIIERDPFDPKRGQDKTAVQGGAVSSEASVLEKKYSVYGIILAGSTKFAYIKPVKSVKRGETEELRKISTGDLVDGWKVKDVTDKGLILVSGDNQVILKVFAPKEERKSDRPVGVATPRPMPAKPVIKPADQKKLKAAPKKLEHPKRKSDFIFPKKLNGRLAVNPFLKAQQQRMKNKLLLQRERFHQQQSERELHGEKEERP